MQIELKTKKYDVLRNDNGKVLIQVDYLGQKQLFSVEQIFAMLLKKLSADICTNQQSQEYKTILTVPLHFKSLERQALLNAAEIAGLNNVQLLNELTAVACCYGYNKLENFSLQDYRNVVFIDFGHSSLQISIVAYSKERFLVLETTSVLVGGRDFDKTLARFFCNTIFDKLGIKLKKSQIEYFRLLKETEKIKKQMSTNSTNLILKLSNIIMAEDDEIGITAKIMICRQEMESICESLFLKVRGAIGNCLANSKLDLNEIHSIEIVGGSSRIPKFKQMIEEIFLKPASTSLNQDEAVACGGAIYCEIQSDRGRLNSNEIKIIDKLSSQYEEIIMKTQDKNIPLKSKTGTNELLIAMETNFFQLAEIPRQEFYLSDSVGKCSSNSWFCMSIDLVNFASN